MRLTQAKQAEAQVKVFRLVFPFGFSFLLSLKHSLKFLLFFFFPFPAFHETLQFVECYLLYSKGIGKMEIYIKKKVPSENTE